MRVKLSFDRNRLRLAIENAEGYPDRADGRGAGVGIVGMTERAASIGGAVAARPLRSGFRVDADLPYQPT